MSGVGDAQQLSQTLVQALFKRYKRPPPRPLKLLLDNYTIKPLQLFLFFTTTILDLLICNTNAYAAVQQSKQKQKWKSAGPQDNNI